MLKHKYSQNSPPTLTTPENPSFYPKPRIPGDRQKKATTHQKNTKSTLNQDCLNYLRQPHVISASSTHNHCCPALEQSAVTGYLLDCDPFQVFFLFDSVEPSPLSSSEFFHYLMSILLNTRWFCGNLRDFNIRVRF